MSDAAISAARRLANAGEASIASYLRDGRRALDRLRDWPFWADPRQLPPEGCDWHSWLILAGRGFGKTRAGAEWITALAEQQSGLRIAMIGATIDEARAVLVEGQSGILSLRSDNDRPNWEPSRGRIVWRNGSQAFLYSGENPEKLRGPEHHYAWCDEIAKWAFPKACWQMLQMGLRLGDVPRALITTTPRPMALLRELQDNARVVTVRGKMSDNRLLPDRFVEAMNADYAGTRLGRQELDGELIEDFEGALWTRDAIEAARVNAVPALKRVVIGVDPPAGSVSGNVGDACGIVAAGLGDDGIIYVLADASVSGQSPSGWARAVAAAAGAWQADRVIAEANNGGAMVAETLRGADVEMPVRLVHASRGKVARAEPVSARYELGRVKHAGAFPALEDEMCGLISGGGYEGPGRSPDRADALVWALTELMAREVRGVEPRIRVL